MAMIKMIALKTFVKSKREVVKKGEKFEVDTDFAKKLLKYKIAEEDKVYDVKVIQPVTKIIKSEVIEPIKTEDFKVVPDRIEEIITPPVEEKILETKVKKEKKSKKQKKNKF